MLALALLLLQAAPDPQPTFHGRLRQLEVPIPRRADEARVDGVLDEPVWREAARLTGFSQYRPVDGRPAEDSTEVLVWYRPDAVFFGIRAFEAHGPAVRATLADRDQIDADDHVRILLDTYDDRRRALMFAVNPLGVQQDGVWSDGVDAGAAGGPGAGFRFDATIDINPDYVFESRGRVTDWGYAVEVRIPFKSIRYQTSDPQDWGLQVLRTTQHSGYEDTWTPAVRANASFLVQSGRLRGLTGLRRGLVMDLTPEFTTRVDGLPRAGRDYRYTGEPDLGATLRWGITTGLSLSATVRPDFSQVEADVGQVTVNQRFALFFPEKRPFFLEGLEQYDTPNRLIYTRRITAPLGGVKLTGKVGATNIAYLSAVDDDVLSATGDHPIYNLLRVRHDLGASSTLGLAYTDRVEGAAYNRVLGADVRVVWKAIWFSTAQAVGSWSRDAAGARAGTLWQVVLFDRTGRAYGNHAEVLGVSPDFEAASGFVPRRDYVTANFFNRLSWYGPPGAFLEQVTTFFGPTVVWRYDDFLRLKSTLEGGFEDTWVLTVRGGWGASVNLANRHQRFDPPEYSGYAVDSSGTRFAVPHGLYNLWSLDAGLSTPNRALTASAGAGAGHTPIFAEAAEGRGWSANLGVTWRPTEAVRVDARWVHLRIHRARDGSRFSTANIPRVKLEYQLSRAIFFRYVGQYFAQDRAGLRDHRTGGPIYTFDSDAGVWTPAGPEIINDFRSDWLFSYRPTPGTVFFLGYGASLTEAEAFRFRGLERTGDGFFLKASYLFRM
ncbi:MAG TPA: DUF5916 domain-containing protein [Gemmatimonadales bacterium]|nr:DUF5916 domain-containing protein [Gemmatimonadales bacterium]